MFISHSMKKITLLFSLFLCTVSQAQTVQSPSKEIALEFRLVDGKPAYWVTYKGIEVVRESFLGLALKDDVALDGGFIQRNAVAASTDEQWNPVLGEEATIRNHYNQQTISLLQQKTNRKFNIVFRVFDEGVAFRYEIPKQKELNYFTVSDELTQFNLTGDHKTFWLPGDFDSQEYVFNETDFSGIDTDKLNLNNGIAVKSIGGKYTVQTPLMMKSKNNLYLNIFEAAVVDYPVMHLDANVNTFGLKARLAPNAMGDLAFRQAPANLPWRTVMVADDARRIVASKMILNLNEPCKLDDVSWIKPMKYVGIWWEMHVGRSTWDYAGSQNAQNAANSSLVPSGKHGATTENTKKYIDFAAKHGFDGVLVEGWNVGWEDWFGKWKEDVFDFVTPYPDFDIKAISEYAKSKHVKMIMHHETSGSVGNYERWMDRAFENMVAYGYPSVKSGYVGRIIPRGEFHDGQAMVRHFNYAARRAADYKLMVNSHESSRPTGYHRTYPNYIAAEAARGNEFNGWSDGNPPMHETILPFTRLLGGPMDYTPGIFETQMRFYDPAKTEMVHTTLVKQLALYVTMYSPLQMAADLPENYERYPDAFQFIKDVALDWDHSWYLEAEPGDYLTVARKAKGKDAWFLGAITDENARQSSVTLDFLPKGRKFKAVIYEDAPNAHWQHNPKAYKIRTQTVDAATVLKLRLAAGGGTAVSIFPI